jgi:hypothetical protein
MRWVEHVERIREKRNACMVLVERSGRIALGITGHMREYNNKMELRKI